MIVNRGTSYGFQTRPPDNAEMFFSWEEIVVWIGVTLFEAWIHTVCLTVFLLFLTLKLDGILDRSWWVIFSPLFVGNALSAYFCVIGFIRMYLEGLRKHAFIRTIWSLSFLFLMTVFEVLLIRKIMGNNNLEYSEILSPVFILLQLITARTCRLYGS
ncbi:transmembrane protein 203 [Frankliniella occidentalis]|uniref:Transmembrane protein 203 n=1 Tax=Frankliniella occidentalis TaxID=133901 RepID=A0A6J1SZL2_FRAOC|nr:transmembrane protein 203 [Frankliniella occidentalis]